MQTQVKVNEHRQKSLCHFSFVSNLLVSLKMNLIAYFSLIDMTLNIKYIKFIKAPSDNRAFMRHKRSAADLASYDG